MIVAALAAAVQAIDAELYDAIFDGILHLIVAFVPFSVFPPVQHTHTPCNNPCCGVVFPFCAADVWRYFDEPNSGVSNGGKTITKLTSMATGLVRSRRWISAYSASAISSGHREWNVRIDAWRKGSGCFYVGIGRDRNRLNDRFWRGEVKTLYFAIAER